MDTFEWNKSKEDLLKEMCLALSDVFEETDYTIVRNPTHGEKMNNIYLRGNNKRVLRQRCRRHYRKYDA